MTRWTTQEHDRWRQVCDPAAEGALEDLLPKGRGALGFDGLLQAVRLRALEEPESKCAHYLRRTGP